MYITTGLAEPGVVYLMFIDERKDEYSAAFVKRPRSIWLKDARVVLGHVVSFLSSDLGSLIHESTYRQDEAVVSWAKATVASHRNWPMPKPRTRLDSILMSSSKLPVRLESHLKHNFE